MIRRLAKSVREFKTASVLSALFVTLEVVFECLIPFIIAWLVDEIEGKHGDALRLSAILICGGILVGMSLLSLLCGALSGAFCAKASTGYARNLRKDLYYKVQDFSFENIDKFSTPSLVTRMTTDITNVQFSFMMIIRIAVRAPIMIVFSLVMAFIMGKQLAWIFVAVIPPLTLILFLIMKKALPLFHSLFKRYDDMNESVQENVKGMRVVKSYVREDYEKRKFGKASQSLCVDFTKAEIGRASCRERV